jgi:MFS family permease
MKMQPQAVITEDELKKGMSLVIRDGIATEVMTAFSGGTFLVALALMLGASNLQVGLLAGLPTFMNIFQLFSIWLVRRFKNRRLVSVVSSLLARIPLIIIGVLSLFSPNTTGINTFILLLCFFYFFGSVAGPSWNSWMKDFIPEHKLGTFFSNRTMLSQLVSVIVSLALALLIDYIKTQHPLYERTAYAYMYIVAGIAGVMGVYYLYKTPEPVAYTSKENIFKLLQQPLKNINFRHLLVFNSAWVFAINIATPFFTVYMLKTLNLPILYIIPLNILSQVSSILMVRLWGAFSDRYSNKTIIAIAAPLYITCIIAWCFVGLFSTNYIDIILIAVINIITGIATAGINLSLINIGLKLSPKEDTIVYLSTKNIITAFFSSLAPLLGGYLADFFANKHLDISAAYTAPNTEKSLYLLSLNQWNFLFVIGAFLALIALQLLYRVKEKGEIEKDIVVRILRSTIKNSVKDYFVVGTLLNWRQQVTTKLSQIFKGSKHHDL